MILVPKSQLEPGVLFKSLCKANQNSGSEGSRSILESVILNNY